MSNFYERQKQFSIKSALHAFLRELRKWYGCLSVDELASNRELVLEIEILERMLVRQS